ncbi:MAG: SRPBCC family protein [Chitinophagaceae bacterium]
MSNNAAIVETQMLIRKPIATVFQAFIDPAVTTRFWFTKSTGKLEEGKTVSWHWDMYGGNTNVLTKQIIPNKLIATEWGSPATSVDYIFTEVDNDKTYVVIKNYGFAATGDELMAIIKDSTGGFTTVLDGLKAWLEHGLQLNLVLDKFPNPQSFGEGAFKKWKP